MKTLKIFDTDAFKDSNEATVTDCKKSNKEGFEDCFEVITDSTIFAPEGGGQKCDEGFFDDVKVIDVQEIDGEIVHFLEKEINAGTKVLQKIDMNLRMRRMQNHNAEHLICGLIHARFGYDNVGFHLSEIRNDDGSIVSIEAIMDVDGPVSAEAIKEIEMKANVAISENVPIYAILPSAEEAEKISYRSKLDISENLRLVIIDGYDVCACCAPCLDSSAQIQLVKIVDFMPHRGGMRLTLKAGIDAVKDYIALHDDEKSTMKVLSCERGRCAEAAERMNVKLTEAHEDKVSLKRQITVMLEKELKNTIRMQESTYIVYFADSIDEIQARALINDNINEAEKVIIVMFDKTDDGYRFVAGKNEKLTEISLKDLAAKMRDALNARGGGSEQMIQGSIAAGHDTISDYFKNEP
ncbi:MAG: hypothetical protein J6X97_07800 [Lachnospiraceae bacterium]|nr:hypothetical protein [Lachnospiraceae bacterium]